MKKKFRKKKFPFKYFLEEFKVKIFHVELFLNSRILSEKKIKKKILNFDLKEKSLIIKMDKIYFLIRSSNAIIFSSRKSNRKNVFKFIFSLEQITNYNIINNIFFFIFFLPKEGFEGKRKELIDYVFLSIEAKINFLKKMKKRKSSVLIVIPNQTCFFQIIRVLYHLKKKKMFISFPRKSHEELFSKIRHGKVIKPADNRAIFSDGLEDFFCIGASIKKKNLFFTKKNLKPDFFFFTPLAIRSLKKKLFLKILNFCKSSLIDNLEIIIMQNPENLFMILKYFLHLNKQTYSHKYRKTSSEKQSNDSRLFPFFVIFEYFSIPANFFPIFAQIRINILKIFKKRPEKLILFKKKQIIFLKFKSQIKISSNKQLLNFFLKNLTNFILKKAKKRIIIFCKRYSEFVSIRNHFLKIIRKKKKYRIIFLSEYSDFSDIIRKKINLHNIKNVIIICTERFYHFYRYTDHNFSAGFFYSVPHNWEFILEIERKKKKVDQKKYVYIFGKILDKF
jgi:hypothetical protein